MSKIAIVTDSNSGITQEEGRRLGVSVIPMPFFINEKMYLEGITLSQDELSVAEVGCFYFHFPAKPGRDYGIMGQPSERV